MAAEDNRGFAVLARGDQFPDGLTASNLGIFPLLLTPRDRLHAAARQALVDLGTSKVFIVGGPGAISEAVEGELTAMRIEVERVAGNDRYSTAARTYYFRYGAESDLPRRIDGKTSIVVASGEQFPDALAASPLTAGANLPLLITPRDSLAPALRTILDKTNGCANGVCVEHVVLIGGTGAVSARVEAEIRSYGVTVDRLQASNRQGTAVAVAEFTADTLGWRLEHFNLTRGDNFPDALAGGPLGGVELAPTLLTVGSDVLGSETESFLEAHRDAIGSFHVFGDESAVSQDVVREAQAAAG